MALDIEKCKECYYADEDGVCEKLCVDNSVFEPKRPNERITEWISVKDRLPEDKKHVLVWEPKFNKIMIARYDKKDDYWWDEECYFVFPTYWQPLPKPPKGE